MKRLNVKRFLHLLFFIYSSLSFFIIRRAQFSILSLNWIQPERNLAFKTEWILSISWVPIYWYYWMRRMQLWACISWKNNGTYCWVGRLAVVVLSYYRRSWLSKYERPTLPRPCENNIAPNDPSKSVSVIYICIVILCSLL